MKLFLRTTVIAVFALGSASVFAKGLTPQQCNDYPFKPLTAEVTRAQLQQELAELEAVGYDPSQDDEEYPQDLQQAEHKLRVEYRADCLPSKGQTAAGNGAGQNQPQDTPAG